MNELEKASARLDLLDQLLNILTQGHSIRAITPGKPLITQDFSQDNMLVLSNLHIDHIDRLRLLADGNLVDHHTKE